MSFAGSAGKARAEKYRVQDADIDTGTGTDAVKVEPYYMSCLYVFEQGEP